MKKLDARRAESTVSPGRPMIRSTQTLMPSAKIALTPCSKAAQVRRSAHQFPRLSARRIAGRSRLRGSRPREAAAPLAASIPSARNSPENASRPPGLPRRSSRRKPAKSGRWSSVGSRNTTSVAPCSCSIAQVGENLLGRKESQPFVALRVVAILAAEAASAHGLQQHPPLAVHVENAFDVRR